MKVVEPIRNKKDLATVEAILARNKRDLLLFVLGTNSGLRVSDILGLNICDVHDKTHIEIIEKKTNKHKKIPLNSKLKPLIAKFITGRNDNEPLFLTRFGNRLDRVQAYRIINQACHEARLTYKIGTHTMRKSFGYHHYQKFRDIVILQKIFNHSSPGITLRYIGIEQDALDESYINFVL
jgi:integrase